MRVRRNVRERDAYNIVKTPVLLIVDLFGHVDPFLPFFVVTVRSIQLIIVFVLEISSMDSDFLIFVYRLICKMINGIIWSSEYLDLLFHKYSFLIRNNNVIIKFRKFWR